MAIEQGRFSHLFGDQPTHGMCDKDDGVLEQLLAVCIVGIDSLSAYLA